VIKTPVYFDEEWPSRSASWPTAQGRSQAEVVRDAVMQYVRQASRPEPKGIGAYRSGRSDISERAEELLKAATRGGQCPP
jgi:hypothetical protein